MKRTTTMNLNDSFILFVYIVEDLAKELAKAEEISEEEALKRVEKILESRLKKRRIEKDNGKQL